MVAEHGFQIGLFETAPCVRASALAGGSCRKERTRRDVLRRHADRQLDVISKCGQPDLREVTSLVFQVTEVWHYNCGEGRLDRSLVFEGSAYRSRSTTVMAENRRSANSIE
jgi:hypothetical protein